VAAFSDDVPNANFASTDTFSASAPTLALQVNDPGPQHDVLRREALHLGPPPLRLGPPELDTAHTTEVAVTHDTSTRSPLRARVQHPARRGVSPG